MEYSTFDIAGLILIKPKVFTDNRGCFLETFHSDKYREAGLTELLFRIMKVFHLPWCCADCIFNVRLMVRES